jgi:hypothetical protein
MALRWLLIRKECLSWLFTHREGISMEQDYSSMTDKELEALEAEVENHMLETLGRDEEEAEIEVVSDRFNPEAYGREIHEFESWERRGVKVVNMPCLELQIDSEGGDRLIVTADRNGGVLLTTKDFDAPDQGWTEVRLNLMQAKELVSSLVKYWGL